MKPLLFILTLVLFGNTYKTSGQESELNQLENLKDIKSSDTLWIDIKKGGCFYGSWKKLIISNINGELQFININDVTKLILKHDKRVLLYNDEENWIRKNLYKIRESENVALISKNEYIAKIDELIKLIISYKNCSTNFAGQYSTIAISMNDINETFNFNCEIKTDL